MNWWQQICAGAVIAFLQNTIKNPESTVKEFAIIRQIRDLCIQIVGAD